MTSSSLFTTVLQSAEFRIRKNVNDLSDEELHDLLQAMTKFKRDRTKSGYRVKSIYIALRLITEFVDILFCSHLLSFVTGLRLSFCEIPDIMT